MPPFDSPAADALAQAERNIACAEGLLDQASRVLAQSLHCVQAIEVLGVALSGEAVPDLDAVRQALEALAFEAPVQATRPPAADQQVPVISPFRFRHGVPAALV